MLIAGGIALFVTARRRKGTDRPQAAAAEAAKLSPEQKARLAQIVKSQDG